MKTNDFISALAQDHAAQPQPQPLRWTFLTAMAAGLGVAVVAFALTLGVRPDVASAIQTWRYDFKFVMTLTLAVTSARLVWRLARPAAEYRSAELAMAAAPLLLSGAVLYELWAVPASSWLPRAIGSNSVACVISIAFLSIAPLAAAFYALSAARPCGRVWRERRRGCSPARLQQRFTPRIAQTIRRCSAQSGTQPRWLLSLARGASPGGISCAGELASGDRLCGGGHRHRPVVSLPSSFSRRSAGS